MAKPFARSGASNHTFVAGRAHLRKFAQKPKCFFSLANALNRQRQHAVDIEGEERHDTF
jgi:hypothetical protein